MKTIAVIGKNGQLAVELGKLEQANIVLLGREDINLLDVDAVQNTLSEIKPVAIINAAAYTAVDKAESDEQAAYDLNCEAVKNLATYCQLSSIHMVHVSTDYVFAGDKGAPYKVDDEIAPQGVYGASKAAGEAALLDSIPAQSCIIRTSWVYATHGNNFVKTMLRLMQEKPELGVIDDQIGSPTWAKGLAQACMDAAINGYAGIYHWSDEGVTSWYDFAQAIQSLALAKGMLTKSIPIKPIPSSAYPTPAKRPHYSVMDKTLTRETFSIAAQHWQAQLSLMLDELKNT